MNSRLVALIGAVVICCITVDLIRRRALREKYAVLWVALSGLLIGLAVFPGLLGFATVALGFELPANLLFAIGGGLLLAVSIQFSIELGRQEERARLLSEELAMQAHELKKINRRLIELAQDQDELVISGTDAPDADG